LESQSSPPTGEHDALRAAQEREAATREILEAISQTRDDVQPVLDMIVRNASRLLKARDVGLHLVTEAGTHSRLAAALSSNPDTFRIGDEFDLTSPLQTTTAIREGRIIHIPDLADDPLYHARDPVRVKLVEEDGIRSRLCVPLLRGTVAFGCINLNRADLRPFADAEVVLVETFAAQAVIAIENVRQFRELQTRLEREAASREILGVISRSRDDETPVFDVILENAARLCDAPMARLHLADAERAHFFLAAAWGDELRSIQPGDRYPLDGTLIVSQTILEARTIHLSDLAESQLYLDRNPVAVRLVEEEGIRTRVTVPLVSGATALGCITLSRREVKPFTEDQIALVETFAAQAVIAIENVRQFRELQTRLEREAATREILEVISRSRDDEAPVFDAILENAARLCKSTMARLHLLEEDGQRRRLAAHWGESMRSLQVGETMPMDEGHPISLSILEGRLIHIEDISETDLHKSGDPLFVRLVKEEGLRTLLTVPLLRDGQGFGCIALSRREVRPYAEDEISLLHSFAAQAVIAIENVRQFHELRTRLEREAATREILLVIAQNRADEKPVFEAILENATRLCNAPLAYLSMANEERTHVTVPAHRGARPDFAAGLADLRVPMDGSKLALVRAITERKVVRMDDIADDELYRNREPNRVAMVEREGARSILAVPMVSDGLGIGAIILYRREVAPFSDDDVALAESFAAQAAIAVDNVKQFRALAIRTEELHELNTNLEDRVEAQVGEIERMGRLKRFLSPAVADAVVSSGNDKLLSSHRALIAVLFCDIRGFTAFCETAEPEETIEVLQTYHEEMGRLIREYGGGVDTRAGDGIMVIFNDPLPCEDPAGDALRLALAMRDQMGALCQRWRRLGHRLGFGVGLSLGYATVGMVGSAGRYDYTASGTAVNLAARLCDEAADGEILLSPRAYAAVEESCRAESLGERSFKGIHAPVEIFRVRAPDPAAERGQG